MKRFFVIFGSIILVVSVLFIHQTRWGISVSEAEVYLETYYEGKIENEISGYKSMGPEEFFSGSIQGWEYPEIFPSDKDEDYCQAFVFLSLNNYSLLSHF